MQHWRRNIKTIEREEEVTVCVLRHIGMGREHALDALLNHTAEALTMANLMV